MDIDPPQANAAPMLIYPSKQGDSDVAGEGPQIFKKCFFTDYLLV